MHKAAAGGTLTDSMRMFNMGLEGGKPAAGQVGVQPEWFYKGDGSCVVGTGEALPSPDFALDGSEEPEIAGIYLIDAAGNPRRIGFCSGQRVLGSHHRAWQLLVAGAFQTAPCRVGRGVAGRRIAG